MNRPRAARFVDGVLEGARGERDFRLELPDLQLDFIVEALTQKGYVVVRDGDSLTVHYGRWQREQ
jgi:hypothetical protein